MVNIPQEVKELFWQDGIRKNLRISFPGGRYRDLTNEDIVKDSFSFTESLCSQDKLKIGLSEASIIEVTCADLPNIKGWEISVRLEVDCSSLGDTWCEMNAAIIGDLEYSYYPIEYGQFIVDSCEKQSTCGLRKVVAYSKHSKLNFGWTDVFRHEIEYSSWFRDEDLEFSYEDIKRLVFPEWAIENSENKLKWLEKGEAEGHFAARYKLPGSDTYNLDVRVDGYYDPDFIYGNTGTIITARATDDGSLKAAREKAVELIYNSGVKLDDPYINIFYRSQIIQYMYPCCVFYLPNGFHSSEDSGMVYAPEKGLDMAVRIDSVFKSIPVYKKHALNESEDILYGAFAYGGYKNFNGVLYGSYLNHVELFIPTRIIIRDISKGIDLYDSGIIDGVELEYAYSCFNTSELGNFHIKGEPKTVTCLKGKVEAKATKVTRTEYKYKLPDNIGALIEGYLELNAKFGKYDRNGTYDEYTLKGINGIFPSEVLYPSEKLYPVKACDSEHISKAFYESISYNDELTKKYRKVTLTYSDGQDGSAQAAGNAYAEYDIVDMDATDENGEPKYNQDDYQIYSLSDNEYINSTCISKESARYFCETVGEAIKDVQYMPASIKMRGLPYLEVGDMIHVDTDDGGFNTYILRRTLRGIQTLTDSIETR